MAILHTLLKGNEHFRFTQPHLHIVGFTHCTRAGLAPSEVLPFCTRVKLFSKLE